VPTADPFSFTAAGAPWVDHEWGAEVLFAGVFRLAGGRGLVALRALLFAAALTLLAALAWDRSRHPLGTVALVAAAAGLVSFFLNLRPHTFTYLLVLALLAAADAHRRGRRRALWWWPPLVALWANLHGGFVLGLGVAGLAAGALLLRRDAPTGDRRRVLVPALLTLAAPLANPYGPGLFAYLVRELGGDHSLVSEWARVAAVPAAATPFFAWTLLPLAGAVAAPRAQRLDQLGLLAIAVAATWIHARFLVLVVLAGTLVLASAVGGLWPRLTGGGRRPLGAALGRRRWAAVACAVLAAAGAVRLGRDLAADRLRLPVDTSRYPIDAAACLAAYDLGPDLALRLDWGGSAVWHLWPDYRVSIDGRNLTVYPAAEVDAQLRAYGSGTLGTLFADRGVDAFLIETGGPALEGLTAGGGWVPVYRDPLAAVLVPPAVAAELPARRRPAPRPRRPDGDDYFP
jgi:hypothetical protein